MFSCLLREVIGLFVISRIGEADDELLVCLSGRTTESRCGVFSSVQQYWSERPALRVIKRAPSLFNIVNSLALEGRTNRVATLMSYKTVSAHLTNGKQLFRLCSVLQSLLPYLIQHYYYLYYNPLRGIIFVQSLIIKMLMVKWVRIQSLINK